MGEVAGSREPLDIVAQKIATHAKKADDYVIAAAMLLREARERVEAGEAGEVTWYAWARKNIPLQESRLRDLKRIAEAKDPRKELERQRRLGRERAERHREQKKVAKQPELEEDRLQLVAWAERAPLHEVSEMLALVSEISGNAPYWKRLAALSPLGLPFDIWLSAPEKQKAAIGL